VDDERWTQGMPQLQRQEVAVRRDASGRPLVASRVPETRPTPLAGAFIWLSIVVLLCGVVAITAVELGTPLASPLVKVPALVGALVLLVVATDAVVRVWRSAWAWMPVDRGRALFRFVWIAAIGAGVAVIAAVATAVLLAR
jgi:hypothetical protein